MVLAFCSFDHCLSFSVCVILCPRLLWESQRLWIVVGIHSFLCNAIKYEYWLRCNRNWQVACCMLFLILKATFPYFVFIDILFSIKIAWQFQNSCFNCTDRSFLTLGFNFHNGKRQTAEMAAWRIEIWVSKVVYWSCCTLVWIWNLGRGCIVIILLLKNILVQIFQTS